MVKAPLPFYSAIGMLDQGLSFLIKVFTLCDTPGVVLYIFGEFRSLDDLPVDFRGGTLIANRALLKIAGFWILIPEFW